MPQVGLKCIRGKIPHQACRICSMSSLHPCDYPAEFIEAVRVEDPERTKFTPSSLLECDRRSALKTGNDYYEDVEAAMNKMRGTIFHAGIDQTCAYPEGSVVDVVREIRLRTTLPTKYGDQVFSGKADVVVIKRIEDGVAYCKVVDYKTKKDISHDLTTADRKHQMQINMYAWLVERCIGYDQGFEDLPKYVVDEVEIIYIDMRKVRRFTSAGALQTRGKRIVVGEYETLTLSPIYLLSMNTVEEYIITRIEEKLEAEKDLPPILDGDRSWECTFCAIKERCYEIG